MASSTAFPLHVTTVADLQGLCQVLWNWEFCESCPPNGRRLCGVAQCGCPWGRRADRLEPFFEFYRRTTSPYVPDFFGECGQAIRHHRDLRHLIGLIKVCGPEGSRELCMSKYFAARAQDQEVSVPRSDQDRAWELAVKILTMTSILGVRTQNAPYQGDSWDAEDHQYDLPSPWREYDTLRGALDGLFAPHIHPSLQDSNSQAQVIKTNLAAIHLKKMAALQITGTDDLRNHLRLCPTTGVLQIFHHTSFLKEHLLATKGDTTPPCLPRAVALETLLTLQLLFPPAAPSQSLLRNLVSKSDFDPDILRPATASFELAGEKQQAMRFPIWGTRLMDLYDEIENPKPRSRVDAWLERRSKSRHIMMVTMMGVLAAVLLGVLGLGLSIFQTWIAWQQLSHGNGG